MSLKKLNLTSVPIPFSGCAGNMNNFVNKSVCENFCSGAELKVSEYCNWRKKSSICKLNFYSTYQHWKGAFEVAEKNSGAICFLSKVAGPCDKKVSNFYYDPNHKDCKHFLYSGCGGNDNRYYRCCSLK